jgi:hypothetical protein
MRTLASLASLALLAVVAPACASDASPNQDEDLLAHRMMWSRPGRYFYSFTWQQGCFCPTEMTRPIRITVETGQIKSAVYADDHLPVSASVQSSLLTIEGVFDLIQHAIDEHAARIDVQYDPLGFPSSLYIDVSMRLADEERSIAISDVQLGGED